MHQRHKNDKKLPTCLGYPSALLAKTDHVDKHNSESKTEGQIKEAMGENNKKRHV